MRDRFGADLDDGCGEDPGEGLVLCPHCFQAVDVDIDPESEGVMVQDCDVCCRPLRLRVSRDRGGGVQVEVTREND